MRYPLSIRCWVAITLFAAAQECAGQIPQFQSLSTVPTGVGAPNRMGTRLYSPLPAAQHAVRVTYEVPQESNAEASEPVPQTPLLATGLPVTSLKSATPATQPATAPSPVGDATAVINPQTTTQPVTAQPATQSPAQGAPVAPAAPAPPIAAAPPVAQAPAPAGTPAGLFPFVQQQGPVIVYLPPGWLPPPPAWQQPAAQPPMQPQAAMQAPAQQSVPNPAYPPNQMMPMAAPQMQMAAPARPMPPAAQAYVPRGNVMSDPRYGVVPTQPMENIPGQDGWPLGSRNVVTQGPMMAPGMPPMPAVGPPPATTPSAPPANATADTKEKSKGLFRRPKWMGKESEEPTSKARAVVVQPPQQQATPPVNRTLPRPAATPQPAASRIVKNAPPSAAPPASVAAVTTRGEPAAAPKSPAAVNRLPKVPQVAAVAQETETAKSVPRISVPTDQPAVVISQVNTSEHAHDTSGHAHDADFMSAEPAGSTPAAPVDEPRPAATVAAETNHPPLAAAALPPVSPQAESVPSEQDEPRVATSKVVASRSAAPAPGETAQKASQAVRQLPDAPKAEAVPRQTAVAETKPQRAKPKPATKPKSERPKIVVAKAKPRPSVGANPGAALSSTLKDAMAETPAPSVMVSDGGKRKAIQVTVAAPEESAPPEEMPATALRANPVRSATESMATRRPEPVVISDPGPPVDPPTVRRPTTTKTPTRLNPIREGDGLAETGRGNPLR